MTSLSIVSGLGFVSAVAVAVNAMGWVQGETRAVALLAYIGVVCTVLQCVQFNVPMPPQGLASSELVFDTIHSLAPMVARSFIAITTLYYARDVITSSL
jgi:hypothetical protein